MNDIEAILCSPLPLMPSFKLKLSAQMSKRAKRIAYALTSTAWKPFKFDLNQRAIRAHASTQRARAHNGYWQEGPMDDRAGVRGLTKAEHLRAHRRFIRSALRTCDLASAIWLMDRGFPVHLEWRKLEKGRVRKHLAREARTV